MTKRTQTEGQRQGLQRAQEARKAMTESPQDRHMKNVIAGLSWIHGWGQATKKNIEAAVGVSRANFLSKPARDGRVRVTQVMGKYFWQLNKSGLDFLKSVLPDGHILSDIQGSRHVQFNNLFHDLYAQNVIAKKLKEHGGGGWWSERMLRKIVDTTEPGAKVPDGAFKSPAGQLVYIEVERSRKQQPQLETMLLNIARLLEKKGVTAMCEIHIEPGISERYVSTLKSWLKSGTFRAWSEDTNKDLFQQGIYSITPTLRDAMNRIQFITARITS